MHYGCCSEQYSLIFLSRPLRLLGIRLPNIALRLVNAQQPLLKHRDYKTKRLMGNPQEGVISLRPSRARSRRRPPAMAGFLGHCWSCPDYDMLPSRFPVGSRPDVEEPWNAKSQLVAFSAFVGLHADAASGQPGLCGQHRGIGLDCPLVSPCADAPCNECLQDSARYHRMEQEGLLAIGLPGFPDFTEPRNPCGSEPASCSGSQSEPQRLCPNHPRRRTACRYRFRR